MRTATRSGRYARARRGCKFGLAVVLVFAGVLLTGPPLSGQAWAQERHARVGVLTYWRIADNPWWERTLEVFRRTLADRGWIEGKNVSFEYRSANSDPSQLAEAAAELVELNVDIIFAPSAPALRAAHAATRSIPIVTGDYTTDPVAEGYVESYARPGGNVTGVFLDAPEFAGKWFELLKAMLPDLSRVAVFWDPEPGTTHLRAVRRVAVSLGIKLQILEVRKPTDIDAAFSALRGSPQALVILPSPMIYAQSPQFARLALEHLLPATAFAREFADAGGTIAYGPELISSWQRMAVLTGRILGGSSAAGLPVERPEKIRLVVNLRTAKALGITIPESILLRADEVIR
jgi:putative ABC transport system substrate-binding protein